MSRRAVPLAVIPAAGLGTRLAPATWAVPKELLPVGPRPMIQWALEEAIEAGLPRVAVVVSPAKRDLISFLLRWRRGRRIKLALVSQPRAVGLGDALLRVRPLSNGRPIALLLPDNVFFPYAGMRSALAQVLRAFETIGRDTTGLIKVRAKDSGTYSHAGLIRQSPRRSGPLDILKLHPKRKGSLRIGPHRAVYKTFARTVLLPHFFDYLEDSARRDPACDETRALQIIVKRHGLSGIPLRGRGFDAGNPAGYAAAQAYWAGKAARS
jgi:UTP--glucose-1-phosphate uridylyltransferase